MAIRRAVRRPKTFAQWLNISAAVVTLCFGLSTLVGLIEDPAGVVLAYGVVVLLSLSWVLLAVQEYRYSRKARYAEATSSVHKAFHSLRDAWFSWRTEDSRNTVNQHVERSLTELAAAFSLVTGTKCRACVKVLYVADARAQDARRKVAVETYVRSGDDPEDAAESVDWLDDNSDFEALFETPQNSCFFRNVLPYPGYKNSHWTEEQMEKGEMYYAATIVWPIRKRLLDRGSKAGVHHPDQDILGFLCVDSPTRNVFERRYDVEVGASFADTLYCLLEPLLPLVRPTPLDSYCEGEENEERGARQC